HLDFEEVVTRAEGATLFRPARQSAIADRVRIGAVESTVGLRKIEVALGAQAALQDEARPFVEELAQFLVAEMIATRFADSRRNLAKQFFNERAQVRLDIPVEEVGADQAHSTVDVVAN